MSGKDSSIVSKEALSGNQTWQADNQTGTLQIQGIPHVLQIQAIPWICRVPVDYLLANEGLHYRGILANQMQTRDVLLLMVFTKFDLN